MKKSYGEGFCIGGVAGLILGFVVCLCTVGSGNTWGSGNSGGFEAIFWSLGHLFWGAVIGAVVGLLIVASMNASIRLEQERRIQEERERQQKEENDRIYNSALIETQNMFSRSMGHKRDFVINAELILNHIKKYNKRCQEMAITEAAKYEQNLYDDFLKTIAGQVQGREHIKLNEAASQLELLYMINAKTGTFEGKEIAEANAKLCHIKDILYKVKPVILSERYGQCDENFRSRVISIDLDKLKGDAFSILYPEALWAMALGLSKDYLTFKSLSQVYTGFCVNPDFPPLDILLSEIMLTKNIGGDLWEKHSTSLFERLKQNANANKEEYYFYLSSGLRWLGFLSEEEKLLDLMQDAGMLKSESLRAHYNQIKLGK